MTRPLISVVIATRNGERFLPLTLASVEAQTFRDFELIVVDDGSVDGTPEIVAEFSRTHAWTRSLRLAGGGVSKARNSGIKAATGPWLAILDHDDVWLPTKLERQVSYLREHPGIVALGTKAHYIGETGRVAGMNSLGPDSIEAFHRQIKDGPAICLLTPSSVLDREAVLKCGLFDPSAGAVDDIFLFEKLSHLGAVICMPEVLMQYRVHSSSLSNRSIALQRQAFRLLDRNRRARVAGSTCMTLSQFQTDPSETAVLRRLRFWRENLGARLYRKAGGYIADSHWLRGVINLVGSAILCPGYVIRKLAAQRIRGERPHA